MSGQRHAAPKQAKTTRQWTEWPLLQPDLSRALETKVRAKAVRRSLVIDDMDAELGWEASAAVTLSYTEERSRAGKRSLRFETALRNESYIEASRNPDGSFSGEAVLFDGTPFSASMRLRFDTPQDWSEFNRLSLWCYPHPNGNPITSLSLQFLCEGADAGPADPISVHYIGDLTTGDWNHLTWEIPEHRRDRVVEFVIFQPLSGVPVREADATIRYDFDDLRIEQVEAEQVDGWAVAPGKLAYSHVGYLPGSEKVAIFGDAQLKRFELIDAHTGDTVFEGAAVPCETRLGTHATLDFTSFARAGSYRLRAGEVVSEPFPMSGDAWLGLAEATLNAFYGLRCGFAVPGVQDACHGDVVVRDGSDERVVGGGWHDAANLTQGPGRTHLSIYALLELHDALASTNSALAERALEEALWGIDWSLRMRFGPGRRCLYMNVSYYTDGLAGTRDDVVQHNVGSDTFQNILATLATARAARAWANRDPKLSRELLRAAEEDFATVLADRPTPPDDSPSIDINDGSWRDEVGYLTLAATELFRATQSPQYAREAARLGRWVMALQETRFVDGSPVTGYFYEDAARTRIVHEYHNSFEESAPAALAALCECFPEHPDWIDWYAALTTYSEYFCRTGAEASAPFRVLPAAVWRRDDLDTAIPEDKNAVFLAKAANPLFPTPPTPELVHEQSLEMFDAGAYLSPDQRLRVFPLWYDHVRHGASVVQLSKTAGLLAASRARGSSDLAELAAGQLRWLLGANPFSRSLVYGVGSDWWQNFTVALPNLVGGMSLGFNSYRDDSPAWGNNAVFPYKEMWVFSSCRLALNLAHVIATAPHSATGHKPASHRGASDAVDIRLDHERIGDTRVAVRMSVAGAGAHRLDVRLSNATMPTGHLDILLEDGTVHTTEWVLTISDPQQPWVLVVIPDGRTDERVDAFGTATPLDDLSAPNTKRTAR